MHSRKLSLFIFASLAVHLTVWAWLRLTSDAPARMHGVVEVDFVQQVAHTAAEEKAPAPAKAPSADKKPKAKAETPAAPTATPPPPAAAAVTGSPGDPSAASNEFLVAVARLIDRSKVYPRESLRREEEGKVVVGVTLNRDGGVGDTRIEEPSPFPALNEAALKAVRTVKFPPVPESVPAPIHLHVPLQFRLQRN